jgi:O-antigen/teichoic acid export membrane protein
MVSRLILLFSIAKLLSPEELGLFGLMIATVLFSVIIIGADYYTYSQRELLSRPIEEWSTVVHNQIKAQVTLYLVLLPAQVFIFVFGFLDWKYMQWFFILLILEHLAQEINRLLISMHKQLMASFVLFMRTASWILVALPIMFFYEESRSLTTLYTAWMIGCVSSIVIGIFAIKQELPNWNNKPTDYEFLVKGFKVGGLFLIATICFKGLLTFDRYAIEALSSIEILGVYVFYIGVVMGAYNLLEPAIFSFLYPRMLQNYQMNRMIEYLKVFRELTLSTIVGCILLVPVIWFVVPIIIDWIDKPIYTNNSDGLALLILAGLAHTLGMIPHYALYAMKGDRWIVIAHISSIMIFFISLELITLENSIQTVALALLLAFSWIASVKIIGLVVIHKKLNVTSTSSIS